MGQRRAVARLLATGAVLTGLFLMHGARLTAGGCHDAGGMAPPAAAVPGPGLVSHLVPASSMPGAGGGAQASCVSTAPRPGDAAVVGLVLVGVVAPRPDRGGRAVPAAWREGRRRAPPRGSALLVSLGVSRT